MNDEQKIIATFRRMDATRKQQMVIIFNALAAEFPEEDPQPAPPPVLSLVRTLIVHNGLGHVAQNGNRCGLLRLAARAKLT